MAFYHVLTKGNKEPKSFYVKMLTVLDFYSGRGLKVFPRINAYNCLKRKKKDWKI